MGYGDIRGRNQHEVDAARIRELEEALRRERESKRQEERPAPTTQTPNQTIIVKNEGCLAGAGKGCLSVIGIIILLILIGGIVNGFMSH